MNDIAFEELAQRAQSLSVKNPRRYRFKVALYALLGYVAIVLSLATLIGIILAIGLMATQHAGVALVLLTKKFVWLAIPAAWILLRALWVRIEPPEGYEVSRQDFPELFHELDTLAARLKTLKIHRVILTPEFNAGVTQTPRLGILGWQQNTLHLGLELLLALSPAQVRSVIAHEFGHLSRNHCAFGGWIYRIRQSWARIMNALGEQESLGSQLMGKFFNWYAPRFSAYSFALARQDEYQADQVAASLTSPVDAADALTSVHVVAPHLEENYWQALWKQSESSPEPKSRPWSELPEFLTSFPDSTRTAGLEKAVAQRSDVATTHPCLTDRLRALGQIAKLPAPVEQSAAQQFLADRYTAVLHDFDENWHNLALENWQERYEYCQQSQQTLKAIEQKSLDELSDEELWQRVVLKEEFETTQTTLAAIDDYVARFPDDPDIHFVHGRVLYGQDDSSCLFAFEKAKTGEQVGYAACEYAYQYLITHHRPDEAREWQIAAESIDQANADRYRARASLHEEDPMEPVTPDAPVVAAAIEQIQQCDLIKEAFIAQKKVEGDPDNSHLVIAYRVKGWHLRPSKVQDRLEEMMPELHGWLVPFWGESTNISKRVAKIGTMIKGRRSKFRTWMTRSPEKLRISLTAIFLAGLIFAIRGTNDETWLGVWIFSLIFVGGPMIVFAMRDVGVLYLSRWFTAKQLSLHSAALFSALVGAGLAAMAFSSDHPAAHLHLSFIVIFPTIVYLYPLVLLFSGASLSDVKGYFVRRKLLK